jgi:hypothetical protein
MIPIAEEARDLFRQNYRQTVEIAVDGVEETFTIKENAIMVGGLVVDRYSVSSSKIELGSACASELSLTLDNREGQFKNVKFEGAELFVRIGITKHDARKWEQASTHYVPLGYFTVDEPARALQTISLSALDRMVLFDKPVKWELFTFPISVKDLLSQTCTICNIPLGVDISDRPNFDYVITSAPADDVTYRQIIQWVAELTATCAFINHEGALSLSWYKPTDVKITGADRYSSDMLENDITISGVVVVDDDSNEFISGNNRYAFRIEGNSLIQHSHNSVCEAIYNEVGGFTYRPYECVVKPLPYLLPLDMIEYVDKDGNAHQTIVTNTTFTMNGSTAIKGQGETETDGGYAAANPMTKREVMIINTIKKALNETLNSSVQSILAFNDLIANSLGVYSTVVTMADGSKKFYMHDAPSIEASNTIYTQNAGGFAYTNSGWNNGDPVWESGFSKDGNIIAKKVNAYGITVSHPSSKSSSQITPGVFSVWYGAMQILSVNGEESIFTKVRADQVECGRIRLLPYRRDGVLLGANLIIPDIGEV